MTTGEARDALNYALGQVTGGEPLTEAHRHALAHAVRGYFNSRGVAYTSFGFEDIWALAEEGQLPWRLLDISRGFARVNVKWFGATGDGSSDDTDAIKAAWAFALATAGAAPLCLYFPTGTYRTSEELAFNAPNNVALIGDGKFASIIRGLPAFVGESVVALRGGPRRTVTGLCFDGKSSGASGLEVDGTYLVEVIECVGYSGAAEGIRRGGLHVNRAKHLRVSGFNGHNGLDAGVLVWNREGGNAVTDKFILNRLHVEECPDGLVVQSFCTDLRVEGGYFAALTGYGIAATAPIWRLTVTDCDFRKVRDAVFFTTSTQSRVRIARNTFEDVTRHAISQDGQTAWEHLAVEDNLFRATTGEGTVSPPTTGALPTSEPGFPVLVLRAFNLRSGRVRGNTFLEPADLARHQVVLQVGGLSGGETVEFGNQYAGAGALGVRYADTDRGLL